MDVATFIFKLIPNFPQSNICLANLMMRPDMHYSTSSSSESDPEEQILPSERRRVRKIRSTFNTHHQLTAAENRYPTTAPTLNPVISGDPYANHIYSQTTVARDRLNQSLDPRAFGSIHNMSVLCQGNSLRGNCSMYGSVNGGVCYDNGHRNLGKRIFFKLRPLLVCCFTGLHDNLPNSILPNSIYNGIG